MQNASIRRHSCPRHLELARDLPVEQLLQLYRSSELDTLGLTDEGRNAARIAASNFDRNWTPHIILHSPMRRALETAEIWAETLGLPMREDYALSELRPPVAILRKTLRTLSAKPPLDVRQIMTATMGVWMKHGILETVVRDAMTAIKTCDENCLVISHGWLMRAIQVEAGLNAFLSHPGFEFNSGFDIIFRPHH